MPINQTQTGRRPLFGLLSTPPRCGRFLSLLIALGSLASMGAAEWRTLDAPPGAKVRSILYGEANGEVWVGGDRGVYRSVDGGQSWNLALSTAGTEVIVQAGPTVVAGSYSSLQYSNDHGATWLTSDVHPAGPPDVIDLAADPDRPSLVLLAANYFDGDVFASYDGAATFADVSSTLLGVNAVEAVEITASGAWVAATDVFTIARSTDDGASWTQSAPMPAGTQVLTASHTTPGLVFAGTTSDGVHRSTDDGMTFLPANNGFPDATVTDIHVASDGRILLASEIGGIYVSADDGLSWSPAAPLGETARAVASDPSSPDQILAGTLEFSTLPVGLFRSSNFGGSWAPSNDGMRFRFTHSHPGVSPLTPGRLVVTSGGLTIVTDNRGRTWTEGDLQGGSRVAGSFANGERFYALSPGIDPFWVSHDGGLTWSPSSSGVSANDLVEFLAASPADPSTLWLGATLFFDHQVYLSTDGGASWAGTSALPTLGGVSALVASPTDSGIAYVGSNAGGVYRTTDGGGSWQPAGLDSENAIDLAVDPADGTLYAATTVGRIWTSSDQGGAWADVTGPLAFGAEVEVDAAGGVVYAVDLGSNPVWSSADGGTTWSPVGNLSPSYNPVPNIESLKADPSIPSRLYFMAADIHTYDEASVVEVPTLGVPSMALMALLLASVGLMIGRRRSTR